MANNKMELFYDNIVYSLQKYGGISTYWYELSTRAMADAAVDIRFFECRDDQDNVARRSLDIPAEISISRKRNTPRIERFLRVPIPASQSRQAIFHSSYFRLPEKKTPIGKICTVHDFTHDKFFKGPRLMLHNFSKKKCIEESDLIITVSQNTKTDLLHYYPRIDAGTVVPIYNGVSDQFKPLAKTQATHRPYFLFIGARFKYKNFDFAVDLVSKCKDYDLYIVGSPLDAKEQALLTAKLANRYRSFVGLTIEELNQIYNDAFLLLYPSSYEGFGIPLLEAMASGCPFIALDASSIPEVAGDAGFLMERLDLECGLAGVRAIESAYDQMVQKGLLQCKLFSWDKCYTDTMDVYKRL